MLTTYIKEKLKASTCYFLHLNLTVYEQHKAPISSPVKRVIIYEIRKGKSNVTMSICRQNMENKEYFMQLPF